MPRVNRKTTVANKAGDILDQHSGPCTAGVILNMLEAAFPTQTGTAAVATDLPTAITLANDLRTKLLALGLIS